MSCNKRRHPCVARNRQRKRRPVDYLCTPTTTPMNCCSNSPTAIANTMTEEEFQRRLTDLRRVLVYMATRLLPFLSLLDTHPEHCKGAEYREITHENNMYIGHLRRAMRLIMERRAMKNGMCDMRDLFEVAERVAEGTARRVTRAEQHVNEVLHCCRRR